MDMKYWESILFVETTEREKKKHISKKSWLSLNTFDHAVNLSMQIFNAENLWGVVMAQWMRRMTGRPRFESTARHQYVPEQDI